VGLKAKAVVRNGMTPLVCIGERDRSKSGIMSEGVGIALREVLPQVEAVLNAVPEGAQCMFAYEPVWAIGAEKPASSDHVVTVVKEIKRVIQGKKKGETMVLYGGSAGPGTWEGLEDAVDGLFLGRFGHDPENVKKVVEEIEAA